MLKIMKNKTSIKKVTKDINQEKIIHKENIKIIKKEIINIKPIKIKKEKWDKNLNSNSGMQIKQNKTRKKNLNRQNQSRKNSSLLNPKKK